MARAQKEVRGGLRPGLRPLAQALPVGRAQLPSGDLGLQWTMLGPVLGEDEPPDPSRYLWCAGTTGRSACPQPGPGSGRGFQTEGSEVSAGQGPLGSLEDTCLPYLGPLRAEGGGVKRKDGRETQQEGRTEGQGQKDSGGEGRGASAPSTATGRVTWAQSS